MAIDDTGIEYMPACIVHCGICGDDCHEAVHLCLEHPLTDDEDGTCTNLCQRCVARIATAWPAPTPPTGRA
jgi:hypothetical protein